MGMIRRVVTFVAFVSTPFLALAASDDKGWSRFFVAVVFCVVFGMILVRCLRTELKEYP